MKCLCILSLMLLWQGGKDVLGNPSKYPPSLTAITYNPEPGRSALKFRWKPVQNWDEQDPIIGYKVAVWEMKTGKKVVHRFVNGELKDEEVEDDTFPAKVPVGQPKVFKVPADIHEVVYGYIKPQVWYEYSALAFTKNGEGPLSPISGIKSFASTNATETE